VKFNVELLTETVTCSELTVKDYKEILKCIYGDNPDPTSFVTTISEVLANITNKPQNYFLNCGIIDVFLLLLKTKINSQSESCKISVTKDDKQMNLELRFDHIYEDIKEWFGPFLNKKIALDTIEITFDSPTLKMLLEPSEDEIVYFIKGCKILGKHDKLLTPSTTQEALMLLESLPPKLATDLYSHFNLFAKEIFNKNLLYRYPLISEQQKLMFSPSIESLIWFTKLMFNEPLDGFYDNLFYLTNLGHFSTDYIERCTPGEYVYFTKKLEYTLSKQETLPEGQTTEVENFDVE
jgi:hypothetical protein